MPGCLPNTTAAYGHSHPFFVWKRDRGVRCHEVTIREPIDVQKLNRRNKKFSREDTQWAKSKDRPFYLVYPARNQVWVYRKNPNWRMEKL